MSEPKVIKYIFAWHSLSDACEKCQQLNGREWYDQDLFQDKLWDMIWGDLWDLNLDVPLTHLHCRCQLEVRVEFDWSQHQPLIDFKAILSEFGFNVK